MCTHQRDSAEGGLPRATRAPWRYAPIQSQPTGWWGQLGIEDEISCRSCPRGRSHDLVGVLEIHVFGTNGRPRMSVVTGPASLLFSIVRKSDALFGLPHAG